MNNFIFNECDIEKVFQMVYKTTPKTIVPWVSSSKINFLSTSSQNNTYSWRFNGEWAVNAVVTGSKEFPLYVGEVYINTYNPDPISTSEANSYVQFNNNRLQSIGNFYNILTDTIYRFGVGTGAGFPYPPAGQNVPIEENNGARYPVFGPFLTVQGFTDSTGTIVLASDFYFKGYQVSIA